jgi:hypothetical protein
MHKVRSGQVRSGSPSGVHYKKTKTNLRNDRFDEEYVTVPRGRLVISEDVSVNKQRLVSRVGHFHVHFLNGEKAR